MSESVEKIVIDFNTGETVVQQLSEEEVAARNETIAMKEAARAEKIAADAARAEAKASASAKLAALGLTEEEVKAILGV